MKNRSGLTLMELSLTIVFISILFTGIFNLLQTQRFVVKRLRNNTAAIFFLESARNYIGQQFEFGRAIEDITSNELKSLITGPAWEIGLEIRELSDGKCLAVSLFRTDEGSRQCAYETEVRKP